VSVFGDVRQQVARLVVKRHDDVHLFAALQSASGLSVVHSVFVGCLCSLNKRRYLCRV